MLANERFLVAIQARVIDDLLVCVSPFALLQLLCFQLQSDNTNSHSKHIANQLTEAVVWSQGVRATGVPEPFLFYSLFSIQLIAPGLWPQVVPQQSSNTAR